MKLIFSGVKAVELGDVTLENLPAVYDSLKDYREKWENYTSAAKV